MSKHEIKFEINEKALDGIKIKAIDALYKAAVSIKDDLIETQSIPYQTGELQDSTYVQRVDNEQVYLVSDTPYAKRVYYHPATFTGKSHWLDTYIDGDNKDFVIEKFIDNMKKGG